jgi:hypothetical protein
VEQLLFDQIVDVPEAGVAYETEAILRQTQDIVCSAVAKPSFS